MRPPTTNDPVKPRGKPTSWRGGVTLELPPGGRQHRAGLVAHEQHAAELLLERVNARRHGGLADVEAIRGSDETAVGDDAEERAGKFSVH